MYSTRNHHTLALLGIGSAIIFASPVATIRAQSHLDAFFDLEDKMVEAHEQFMEAREKADPKVRKNLPDPRTDILKKIDKMAAAHLGTQHGSAMAIGSFTWSWNLDLDLPNLSRRFSRLAENYPNDDELNDVLSMVPSAAIATQGLDKWSGSLRALSLISKEKTIQINALLALGQIHLKEDKADEATKVFKEALALKPEDELKEMAQGWIHESKHLQPGMKAPTFETTTLNDKKVSLASLKGKAVLLNFWASW